MSETEFAKNHLREHLSGLLVPPISEGFWSIYESSKKLCESNGQTDQILRTFQNMLTRIPEWSDATLSTEVERIVKVTKCTYLDDLLMGVFISYMKSFASLHYRGSSSQIKIEFERPNFTKFVHELYKHSARKIWQVAYLFKTIGVGAEQQARNRQDVEKIIGDCMEQVIRTFLPWEQIAKNYFVDTPSEVPSQPPAASKSVMFEDVQDAEESSDEEEEEDRPKMKLSDEVLSIEIDELDKPKEETKTVTVQAEVDPLKEIEANIGESLVLNM
jgi:Family of unknown function (DUF5764)